jgi:hypothetical protein
VPYSDSGAEVSSALLRARRGSILGERSGEHGMHSAGAARVKDVTSEYAATRLEGWNHDGG